MHLLYIHNIHLLDKVLVSFMLNFHQTLNKWIRFYFLQTASLKDQIWNQIKFAFNQCEQIQKSVSKHGLYSVVDLKQQISPASLTEIPLWTLTGLKEYFKTVSVLISATAMHQIKEWKLVRYSVDSQE